MRSRQSLRPAPLTRRLTALAYSGGVRAVPASRRHEGPRGATTGALTRLHATIVLGLWTHHAGSLRSEREGQAQWTPPSGGGDAPAPLVTVYQSSRDPYRQNHSSGPISQPGEAIGPTESSHMVAFAPSTSPTTTSGPPHPAPLHSATPQRISTLDKLETPAPRVGSPTTSNADRRLGSTTPRQAKSPGWARPLRLYGDVRSGWVPDPRSARVARFLSPKNLGDFAVF